MGSFQYQVTVIDGDYAHLLRIDIEGEETKLVARALLPDNINEGTRLSYENFEYNILLD